MTGVQRPCRVSYGTAERLGIRRPMPVVATAVAPGRQPPVDLREFDPDTVLRLLPRWGWTMVAYGDRAEPDLLVAHYVMADYVDVFLTRGLTACGAYRARIWPDQDPVRVYAVTWSVVGDLTTVLWGLLNLRPVERGWPDYEMAPELRQLLPDASRTHHTIRPPQ